MCATFYKKGKVWFGYTFPEEQREAVVPTQFKVVEAFHWDIVMTM